MSICKSGQLCGINKRFFSTTRHLYIDPASYSALAFASKSTLGLPVSLLAPFLALLGLGYVVYNVTLHSIPYTENDFWHIDRSTYIWQNCLWFNHSLHEFLTNVNANVNQYNYSELMSLYDSLNQLYVEVNSYLNNLDSMAQSSLSDRDNGTMSRDWLKLADSVRADQKDILDLLKFIEPRIDAYKFFSELYF